MKLRATNSTDVFDLLISDASRLMTRCRATELNVAAGLLVTTSCGEAMSVAVTLMCRCRLFDSLRGHPVSMLLLRLIPVSTVAMCLDCLASDRLQRRHSGRLIRRVMATIGPNVVDGPRNITFMHCLCRLVVVVLDVLTIRALFNLMSFAIRVAVGSRFTTVWVTTDPLELDELIKLICLLLVTLKLILLMTGPLPTVTPRRCTMVSTWFFLMWDRPAD